MRVFLLSAMALSLAGPVFAQQCHQEPIQDFFPKFAASIALQEETASDLVWFGTMNHDADPEPQLETILITRAEVLWPVVPNFVQFERSGGSVAYDFKGKNEYDEDEYLVTLSGDSGYLVSLSFFGPCWELRSIMDESM